MNPSKEQDNIYSETMHLQGNVNGVFKEITKSKEISIFARYQLERRTPLESGYFLKHYALDGVLAYQMFKIKEKARYQGLRNRVIFSDNYLQKERESQRFSWVVDGQGTINFLQNKWRAMKSTFIKGK